MSNTNRRKFVKDLGALMAVGAAGELAMGEIINPFVSANLPRPQLRIPGETFVGIQMSPHTMLDEGIEQCLDLCKEKAGVNAVFPYSHAFHTRSLGKPLQNLATDHGKPPRDLRNRVPSVYVRHSDKYFNDTPLRVKPPEPGLEFSGRDLFSEIRKPADSRNIKVFARILESTGYYIENFEKVLTVDVYGNQGEKACWSNPYYANFWNAIVADMFNSYDLDGFQWGAERMGPLMNIILPWNNNPPVCFCEHCISRGREASIDPLRAREGYRLLFEYVQKLMSGAPAPAEGVFTIFLRHIIRYPEILSWEYLYRQSREDIQRGMYTTIKSIKPDAIVGWHVDHQPSSWDIVYRAEMSYEEMAPYSDYIKLILYHEVLGPRIRSWYLDRFKKTILSEISLEQSLELYYDLFGYDKNVEPGLDKLSTEGFSPDYVYRETARSVASANGKTKIFAGIGIDVPGSPPDDPETVYQATLKALQAEAGGIVISREYEEMRVPNLEAIGRAVSDFEKKL
ncbi:MAG: hypothetical protein E4G95_07275 [Bacteroidia bacterium]|nr:MAG: hypothetical protein E4G95_07275 [Bacteroidia bacterium]